MFLPSGRELTNDAYGATCRQMGVAYLQPTGRRLDEHCCGLPADHDGRHRCTDGHDRGCGLRWETVDDRGVPLPAGSG